MRTVSLLVSVLLVAGVAQAGLITQTILVDFGEPELVNGLPNPTYLPSPEPPYNNMEVASTVADAMDTTGALTGVTIVTAGFTTDGMGGEDANNLYPYSAQKDYVGCSYAAPSTITMTGLTEAEYTIVLFGSRELGGSWTDDGRILRASVDGGTTWQEQHIAGNTTKKMSFLDVAPVGGTITVDVIGGSIIRPDRPDPPGTPWGYAYVNVMEVNIPEPATMSLLALGGLALIRRRR